MISRGTWRKPSLWNSAVVVAAGATVATGWGGGPPQGAGLAFLRSHGTETSVTTFRLLAEASAHEVLLTQRLQDVEAQDVFAQMGGVQGNEPVEKRLEEQAAPTLSSSEQGQGEEKEDAYAGLEVYGEYR